MYPSNGYLQATRHPWPSLVFLLPLLLVYECGVVWLSGSSCCVLRNGADDWLRLGLRSCGVHQMYLPPLILAGVFFVWSILRRRDQPPDTFGVTAGMVVESVLFALGLWAISHRLT